MAEKNSTLVEMLKYPVLVFSIVAALVVAKYLLGVEFGVITEVSTQGVKFAEQSRATVEALANLEASLNESLVRIQALEKHVQASPAETKRVESEAFSAAQTVSDATATIARLNEAAVSGGAERMIGYIWIGNYNRQWNSIKLGNLDTGQPIELPPQEIEPGTEYKVLGNMVLRAGLPPNDQDYFRAQASLGVIPRGTKVSIRRRPVGIDREFAIQYWAEIEVVREMARR